MKFILLLPLLALVAAETEFKFKPASAVTEKVFARTGVFGTRPKNLVYNTNEIIAAEGKEGTPNRLRFESFGKRQFAVEVDPTGKELRKFNINEKNQIFDILKQHNIQSASIDEANQKLHVTVIGESNEFESKEFDLQKLGLAGNFERFMRIHGDKALAAGVFAFALLGAFKLGKNHEAEVTDKMLDDSIHDYQDDSSNTLPLTQTQNQQ